MTWLVFSQGRGHCHNVSDFRKMLFYHKVIFASFFPPSSYFSRWVEEKNKRKNTSIWGWGDRTTSKVLMWHAADPIDPWYHMWIPGPCEE